MMVTLLSVACIRHYAVKVTNTVPQTSNSLKSTDIGVKSSIYFLNTNKTEVKWALSTTGSFSQASVKLVAKQETRHINLEKPDLASLSRLNPVIIKFVNGKQAVFSHVSLFCR